MRWRAHSPPTPDFYLYAWGADDEQLLNYVMRAEALVRAQFAPQPVSFFRTLPLALWWLLDKENFGILLNGDNYSNASLYWNGSRLPSIENTTNAYYEISELEGSPRRSWSHGH